MEEQRLSDIAKEVNKEEQPKQRLSDIAKEYKKEEQPEQRHIPIVLIIILIIQFIVENFRAFVGLIGLVLIIVSWLMSIFSFDVEGIMIFVVGVVLELIVWITGPITIHIDKK